MNLKKYSIISLIVILSLLRFINLDNDVPPYNIAGISQTDEPYYCLLGFNDYLKENNRIVLELNEVGLKFLYFHNYYLSYWGLKYLGNNYYGLRIGAVLISLLSIILLLFMFFERNKNFTIRLFIVLLLFSEFSFGVMSRFQNPQIYGIFWITLAWWMFHKFNNTNNRFFRIIGLAIGLLTVILVYPYALFFAIGCALWLGHSSLSLKSFKPILDGVFALILSIIVLIGFLSLAEMTIYDVINEYIKVGSLRDERNDWEMLDVLKSMITQIVLTNLFRFNLLLFFPLISLLYFGIKEIKSFHKSNFYSLCFFVLVAAFIQAGFISSYPFKKWVLLFPTMIVALSYFSERIKLGKIKGLDMWIIIGICMLLTWYNWKVTNSLEYWSGMKSYKFLAAPYWMELTLLIIGLFIYLLFPFLKNKSKYLITYLGGMIIIGSIYSSYYFCVSSTTNIKDLLIEKSSLFDNGVILGDFAHTYSLYNNGTVLLNPYEKVFRDVKNNDIKKVLINRLESKSIWIEKTTPNKKKQELDVIQYGVKMSLEDFIQNECYRYNLFIENEN